MKRMLVVFVVLLLALLSFAAPTRGFERKFETVSSSEMKLDFELGSYVLNEVVKDGVTYIEIDFDAVRIEEKGYAEIPFVGATVQIGDVYDYEIASIQGDYTDIKLAHPLLPSRGVIYRNQDPSTIPYEIDSKSVVDKWYPEKLAENLESFIFRDTRGTNVYAYPFQYNAVTQVLRVYDKMTVTLQEDYSSSTNPMTIRPDYVASGMSDIYRSLFINYDETKAPSDQLGEFGEILVIYTSRDATVIQPYITWKREKGFQVHEIQVAVGTNVKTTIQNAYNSNPNLLFVQLVGGWNEIKSDIKSYGGGPMNPKIDSPTCPMMGCVAGGDLYPELIIGRFSAENTTHVTTQVNKTINYEKNADMGATWYRTAMGIARNEGEGGGGHHGGEGDDRHMEYIRNKLLSYNYSTVHRDYDGNSSYSANTTAAQISNRINAGTGIINFCNHGSETSWSVGNFSSTHVNALTNGNKLPFIWSVACVNGRFQETAECFAETWVRKEEGGAVIFQGSSINQAWQPPMTAQDYMNDLLIGGYNYSTNSGGDANSYNSTAADKRTIYGALYLNGNILMLSENYSDATTLSILETWHAFGDVSLQVRTDTPKTTAVSNTTVEQGKDYTTNIKASNNNFHNALVSLYQNGNTYSGFTASTGNVTINHGLVGGAAKLVVTGYNIETKYYDITVSGTGGSAPAIPVLISPEDGSYTSSRRPAFDWSDVTGADTYTIQIDNNANFNTPEVTETVTASNFTPSSDLGVSTQYWRVRANNSYGSSAYAAGWTLHIGNPPGAPTLVSPANGSSTTDQRPTFDWNDVAGATSYTILADNNADFSSPEINQSPTVSQYTPTADMAYGTYYWKVAATSDYGTGDFSATWSVTIEAPPPPVIALSKTQILAAAEPEGTDIDSFEIGNTGDSDLTYSITHAYIEAKGAKSTVIIENNFGIELGWTTTTNNIQWIRSTDGTENLDGTAYARLNGRTKTPPPATDTATLTSGVFDGTGHDQLLIDFDQYLYLTDGNSAAYAEYTTNGSTWNVLFSQVGAGTFGAWGTPDKQSVQIPSNSATMQIRFRGVIRTANPNSQLWAIDNVAVTGSVVEPPLTWLVFNSPLSGTVTPSGLNDTINLTCDAAGLVAGTYNANITVSSNDPVDPAKVITVEFVVSQSTIIPGTPANITTSIVGTDLVIDWDVSADATSYDVYSSGDPYGTFTFEANVGSNQYVTPYTEAKKFYYIVSKNATK